MEFYYRKEGKTLGPLTSFRIKELLEDGQLERSDIGWHEGMEEWKPLGEISALEMFLPRVQKDVPTIAEDPTGAAIHETHENHVEPVDSYQEARAVKAALPKEPKELVELVGPEMAKTIALQRVRQREAWRRFFARLLDLALIGLLVWAGGVALGLVEPGELVIPRFVVIMISPFIWIPFEALCLKFWGFTPGKAMLGLRVVTADGTPISMRRAFSRAFDVWFTGCGAELPILNVVTKVLAMAKYRVTGETSWDEALKLKVVHHPLAAPGIMLAIMLAVTSFVLRFVVIFNSPLPSHLTPEERNYWEEIRNRAIGAGERISQTEPSS